MKWTLGRKLSLVVAAVDALVIITATVMKAGSKDQFVGAIAGSLFMLQALALIWFPERMADFLEWWRSWTSWGWYLFDYDANLCTLIGWLFLAIVVPAIAIFWFCG
jgi:hypothetical protein